MNSKTHILQIPSSGFGIGGVSSVILSILEQLHTRFDFTCLVFDKQIGAREHIAKRYAQLHRVKWCYAPYAWYRWFVIMLRPFTLYWVVYKLCKQNHYQVIHCHNGYDQWICLLAAKHAGVKIRIAHSHNTKSPACISWMRRAYNRFAVCVINQYATTRIGCSKQACLDFFGADVSTQTIYNAVDLTKFDIKKHTPFQNKRFIHVGRYTYQKNQEFVLNVFYLLKKQSPDSTLALVGSGGNKTALENQIKRLHLEDCVQLVDGRTTDVSIQYAQADYMIFPSHYEGFGIVLIEAQAMGIHCFVSESIQPDVDVGLMTFLDLTSGPAKWADVVADYIKQHNQFEIPNRKELGKFDPQNIAMQYQKIYEGNN